MSDLEKGESKGAIASRFYNTIAAAIADICSRIRERDHLDRVCLRGGTSNIFLLKRAVALLRKRDFEVFLHSQVPPNHGGISLGQAVIASQVCKTGV